MWDMVLRFNVGNFTKKALSLVSTHHVTKLVNTSLSNDAFQVFFVELPTFTLAMAKLTERVLAGFLFSKMLVNFTYSFIFNVRLT